MATNTGSKPAGRNQDRKEGPMDSDNLFDKVEIISVDTRDGGKYLCFTDNKGEELCIKISGLVPCKQKAKHVVALSALKNICPKGKCELRPLFGTGARAYFLRGTPILCPDPCS